MANEQPQPDARAWCTSTTMCDRHLVRHRRAEAPVDGRGRGHHLSRVPRASRKGPSNTRRGGAPAPRMRPETPQDGWRWFRRHSFAVEQELDQSAPTPPWTRLRGGVQEPQVLAGSEWRVDGSEHRRGHPDRAENCAAALSEIDTVGSEEAFVAALFGWLWSLRRRVRWTDRRTGSSWGRASGTGNRR